MCPCSPCLRAFAPTVPASLFHPGQSLSLKLRMSVSSCVRGDSVVSQQACLSACVDLANIQYQMSYCDLPARGGGLGPSQGSRPFGKSLLLDPLVLSSHVGLGGCWGCCAHRFRASPSLPGGGSIGATPSAPSGNRVDVDGTDGTFRHMVGLWGLS